jgi:hypothetical protein
MHRIKGIRKRFFEVFFIKKVNAREAENGLRSFALLKAADMVPFR